MAVSIDERKRPAKCDVESEPGSCAAQITAAAFESSADETVPDDPPERTRPLSAQCRYARVTTLKPSAGPMRYVEGESYDEVRLTATSQLVTFNSIVLVPNLMSHAECASLVHEVDSRYEAAWRRPGARARVRLCRRLCGCATCSHAHACVRVWQRASRHLSGTRSTL